ncbi:MAG: RNA ligase (ATP) [Bacteroidetes bacterium]|nr:MAG: RNA ligase (ATP) [Bacteroidota bacterium]
MSRKLASIQKILALESIEGADAIEKATVLGWQLVVKKGEYNIGDLCVYCEIDSLLPERPEFEFMKPRGMRVRTIRLRGQISQGICFQLSILPPDFQIVEDADCTETLEITKYEAPIPASLAGKVKGRFPSFMHKTDETRVQVLQSSLDKYNGQKFYITEKLDGSSCTYYLKDGEFGVCSRNLELLEDDENSLWKVARQLDIEQKLRSLSGNYALQGELIGEGIQSNKYKIKGQDFRIFNVFNIDAYEYLNFTDFVNFTTKLGLKTVPVLSENYVLENNIPTIITLSTIKSTLMKEVWAEGIVLRPLQELKDFGNDNLPGGRVSFKAINPEFLLKYGE